MISLDTSALVGLIWRDGVPVAQRPHFASLERVLRSEDAARRRILVSTIALTEALRCWPDEAAADAAIQQMSELGILFAPFDVPAARIAAKIFTSLGGRENVKSLAKSIHRNYEAITNDTQIHAVAISRGASLLLTSDKGLYAVANRYGQVPCTLLCDLDSVYPPPPPDPPKPLDGIE